MDLKVEIKLIRAEFTVRGNITWTVERYITPPGRKIHPILAVVENLVDVFKFGLVFPRVFMVDISIPLD